MKVLFSGDYLITILVILTCIRCEVNTIQSSLFSLAIHLIIRLQSCLHFLLRLLLYCSSFTTAIFFYFPRFLQTFFLLQFISHYSFGIFYTFLSFVLLMLFFLNLFFVQQALFPPKDFSCSQPNSSHVRDAFAHRRVVPWNRLFFFFNFNL